MTDTGWKDMSFIIVRCAFLPTICSKGSIKLDEEYYSQESS